MKTSCQIKLKNVKLQTPLANVVLVSVLVQQDIAARLP